MPFATAFRKISAKGYVCSWSAGFSVRVATAATAKEWNGCNMNDLVEAIWLI